MEEVSEEVSGVSEEEEEEVGSSEEGPSGKVSFSEKVVLVLLAVEAGAVKEGCGFLPSSRVLGRAIKACAIKSCAIKACTIKASSGSSHEGECEYLKQVNGASTSLRGPDSHGAHGSMVSQSVGRVAVRCHRRVGLIKLWR